jgi:membrane-associated phospholipid phosphatase
VGRRLRAAWGVILLVWRMKLAASGAILLYYFAGYFTLNRIEFPRYYMVPRTPLDDLPFLPWSFAVYNSVFILGTLGIWMHRGAGQVKRYLAAVLIGYTVNYAFFALVPTEIERPPAPQTGSMWTWLVELTQAADRPHTCFPSLHMTNCFLAVFAYWRTRAGLWLLGWTLVIAASTLTTKQHYFWDLPAGAAVAAGAAWLAGRVASRGESTVDGGESTVEGGESTVDSRQSTARKEGHCS